jgi:hypothetical protein
VKYKINEIFPKILREIKSIEKDVVIKGWKDAAGLLQEDIVASISKGLSPVAGEKRFTKYSDSYTDAIKSGKYGSKKVRPVNLRLTAHLTKRENTVEMLASIESKQSKDGFTIDFKKTVGDGKNLAEIHSFEGAGKSKTIRKILPDKDGNYKDSILLRCRKYLRNITNDVLVNFFRRL